MANLDELLIVLNRSCSNIQSEDKKKRKQALDELSQEIFEKSRIKGPESLDTVFDSIQKNVWKSLYDQSEAVRDSAITLLSEFVSTLNPNEKFLGELIPILLWRLGDKETNEPSEEIRLRLIILLNSVILKYGKLCSAFTEDTVQILSKTLVDSYPKLRQESCICASNLACTVPQTFYEHTNKLIKPILLSFNHQHFRMRVAAIEALGKIVRWGSTKNLPTQEVFGSLAERLFDSSPNVRSAVTKVIGDWLINLRDRYSFFSKMIPLILTSLCDESPELREEAWEIWSKAGLQYEKENEQELKDKMDFLYEKPDHYPPNVLRPNLGCRTLVQRNTCQITPALSRELEDWKNDIRIKSAQLLCWLVLHAETDITQHTESLLLTMYKVCNQNDIRVVENVEKAAEYIAYFVSPDEYMQLIVPAIKDVCTAGHLCVLAALIKGSKRDLLSPHVVTTGELISEDNICRVRKSDYQWQLLKCCDALLKVAEEECCRIGSNLFLVLVTVRALSQKPQLTETALDLMKDLCNKLQKESVAELYEDYTELILEKMDPTVESWTSASCDRFILQLVLEESDSAVGLHLEHLNRLLKSAMRPEADSLVRSKLFILMGSILARRHTSMRLADEAIYNKFMISFIQDIICPNLVWKAGRTAEALRTVVVACLCVTLLPVEQSVVVFSETFELPDDVSEGCSVEFSNTETTEEIFKALFPLLLNSVEDSAVKTRLFSLKSLQSLIILAGKKEILTPDHVNQSYPLILKRLDDVSNDVRINAVQYLKIMYSNLPPSYNPVAFEPHLGSLFTTLLIHLDDPNENFQKFMLELLKTVGKVDPKVMHDKLDAVKNRFRNFGMCNDILDYLKNLHITNA